MIYQICNYNHEQNGTFFKIAIIKKSDLTYFNHLTPDIDIISIISNLQDSINAMVINLLPEDINLKSGKKGSNSGPYTQNSINFTLTPQNKNLQNLLETYNNTEVLCLLDKHNTSHLYGTAQTPLLIEYAEIHSNAAQGKKGYTVNLKGDTLGNTKIFENVELNIYSAGLAFDLSAQL